MVVVPVQHPNGPHASTGAGGGDGDVIGHLPPPTMVSGPYTSPVRSGTEHDVWNSKDWPLLNDTVDSAANLPPGACTVNCWPSVTVCEKPPPMDTPTEFG